jgi:hypothetical protein
MVKLPMVPARADKKPSISFDHRDHLPHFHSSRLWLGALLFFSLALGRGVYRGNDAMTRWRGRRAGDAGALRRLPNAARLGGRAGFALQFFV